MIWFQVFCFNSLVFPTSLDLKSQGLKLLGLWNTSWKYSKVHNRYYQICHVLCCARLWDEWSLPSRWWVSYHSPIRRDAALPWMTRSSQPHSPWHSCLSPCPSLVSSPHPSRSTPPSKRSLRKPCYCKKHRFSFFLLRKYTRKIKEEIKKYGSQ